MSDYPMWHRRFVNARNALGNAACEMEQAAFEDGNNPQFGALHKRIAALLASADKQLARNFKRVKKGRGR